MMTAVMRVLVVGGTEFISLALVRALIHDGHAVTVLNRGRKNDRLPAGVSVIPCDRKDHAALQSALAGARFDGVCDITYAPTAGEDVAALADALAGAPAPAPPPRPGAEGGGPPGGYLGGAPPPATRSRARTRCSSASGPAGSP